VCRAAGQNPVGAVGNSESPQGKSGRVHRRSHRGSPRKVRRQRRESGRFARLYPEYDLRISQAHRAQPAKRGADGISWTPANVAKLHAIAARVPRPSVDEIGIEMGTTGSGIQTAMSRYGVTRGNGVDAKSLTRRLCMNCSNPFMSTGSGNRRCPKCIAADSGVAA
jgi:hypothetical protein